MNHRLWMISACVAGAIALTAIGLRTYYNKAVPQDLSQGPWITGRALEKVSDLSKEELSTFVKKTDIIVGVQVVQANLIKNNRRTIYFNAPDKPELQKAWDDYQANRDPSVPNPSLFFKDKVDFNERTATILNGEFTCVKFEDTINFLFWPEGQKFAPWVCSQPVPPGTDKSGDFNGFINFFLSHEPTDKEQAEISKASAQISSDIYKRDVENAPENK